jgi:hypothetical protein
MAGLPLHVILKTYEMQWANLSVWIITGHCSGTPSFNTVLAAPS